MGDDILLLLVYVLLSGVFLVMTITINKRMKNGYKIKDAPKYRLFNGTENIRGTIMLMVFFTLFVIGYWGVKHYLRIQPPSIAKIDMALQKDPLLFALKELLIMTLNPFRMNNYSSSFLNGCFRR